MSHQIKFNERFSTSDQPFFIGEVIFGTGLKQIEFTDPYGNKSFRSEFEKELYRKHNIVVIGGYQFAFSKLFNIEMDTNSTLRVGDLNDDAPLMKIGVNRASYQSIKYNAETNSSGNASMKSGVNISALNHIFGFMIGDGGSTENNITVVAPDYKRRTLFRAVPFRMSNDGSEINEAHYFGKTSTLPNGNSEVVTSYYIKTFDNPPPHTTSGISPEAKASKIFCSSNTEEILTSIPVFDVKSAANCRISSTCAVERITHTFSLFLSNVLVSSSSKKTDNTNCLICSIADIKNPFFALGNCFSTSSMPSSAGKI